jgi:mannose-1-phosphate guanylyltransferase
MRVGIFLAGGKGTRLWPLSDNENPKSLTIVDGSKSLLQRAVTNVEPIFKPSNLFFVIERKYAAMTITQLPKIPLNNLILEPYGRDSAVALSFAVLKIAHQFGDDTICQMLTSDFYIKNNFHRLLQAMELAMQAASESNCLVGIGFIPKGPDTKFGYWYIGEKIDSVSDEFIKVFDKPKFEEKPSEKLAKEYFSSKKYLWNSGMLAFRCSTFLNAVKNHVPKMYKSIMELKPFLGTVDEAKAVEKFYSSINSPVSFDYLITEKERNLKVIGANVEFIDIGTWEGIEEYISPDMSGNSILANNVSEETSNCLIFSNDDTPIYTLGVSNLVIVNANGIIFVCEKDKLSNIKEFVLNKMW